jgi:putative lipoprotein
VIGTQVQTADGKQVPIPFAVAYDPGAINERLTYSVSAIIEENGKVTWRSTQAYPVITRGAPTAGVEIMVEQVP